MRAALVIASLLIASRALAGNDDGILIGSEAMLSGGAVTATVSDGAAAWYNPAGLANMTRHTLNINASTYGVSYTSSNNLFTLPDGTQNSASTVDWQLVPCALSYARPIGRALIASFGVFVPTAHDQDLRASLLQRDNTRWTFGADNYRTDYAYIASLSGRISETLRWGVALHGVYISEETMFQFGVGGASGLATSALSYSSHRTTGDYGLRVGVGMQWQATPNLALGVAVQTQTLTALRLVNEDIISLQASVNGQPAYDARHDSALKSVWELSTPLVLRVGLAYTVNRVRWLLDGSFVSPVNRKDNDLDRRATGNARAGFNMQLSDGLSVGAGGFSDLDGTGEVNYLGVSGGVKFTSNYRLQPDGRPLTFVTSLGGRYAYGWGKTGGLDLRDPDALTPGDHAIARLRANEFALNLGGGVSY